MKIKPSYLEVIKKSTEKARTTSMELYKSLEKNDAELKKSSGKGIFHTYTEKGGDFTGKAITKPLSFIGKKTEKPYIEEIADTLHGSAKFTGGVAGQLIQGTWKLGQGIVKKDKDEFRESLGEYTGATGRTVTAMFKSATYTLKNSGLILNGLYNKDYEKAMTGLKGVGKVVIVGTVAITVFDLVEGDNIVAAQDGDFLSTYNNHLAGQVHPETGVLYEAQSVELPNGTEVVGVFPVFDAVAEIQLPTELYESNDSSHFLYANLSLSEAITNDSSLGDQFTAFQLNQIDMGKTPDGYSWHHHEHLGKLQLVDEDIHAQSSHTGGRVIWGGGQEAR